MRKKNKLWDACSAFFEVLGGRSQYTEYDDDEATQPTPLGCARSGQVSLYKATNGMILEVNVFSTPDKNGYHKETRPMITFVPEEDMEKIGDVITRSLTISTLAAK